MSRHRPDAGILYQPALGVAPDLTPDEIVEAIRGAMVDVLENGPDFRECAARNAATRANFGLPAY